MRESPRVRRLRTDARVLARLKSESTILDVAPLGTARPPEAYRLCFRGKGLWRRGGTKEIFIREHHEVSLRLGAAYPRAMPNLEWRTPIFHPNISASGVVCLGGFSTHWVPSLNLDDLCVVLWDMIRYENYDIRSAYNREAALWARDQRDYRFPVDPRPLRDKVAGVAPPDVGRQPPIVTAPRPSLPPEVVFPEGPQVVEAEIVEPEGPEIVFLD